MPSSICKRSDGDAAGLHPSPINPAAIAHDFERFTQTTTRMAESYRLLDQRVRSLDRKPQDKNRELSIAIEYLNAVQRVGDRGEIEMTALATPKEIVVAFRDSDPGETSRVRLPRGEGV